MWRMLALTLLLTVPAFADAPEWKQKIQGQLSEKRITLDFEEAPLTGVLQFIEQVSQIPMLIDPRAKLSEKTTTTLRIRDLNLGRAMHLVLVRHNLDFRLCCGMLVISRPTLLATFPADGLTVPEKQKQAYAPLLCKVSFAFSRMTLSDMVKRLSKKTKQTITVSKVLNKKSVTVDLKVDQVSALQALSLIATICKGEFVRTADGAWLIKPKPQPRLCPDCARQSDQSWKFCAWCGQKLKK